MTMPMRQSKQWKTALAMAMSFFCGCAMTASYQQGGVSAVALYASNAAIQLPAAFGSAAAAQQQAQAAAAGGHIGGGTVAAGAGIAFMPMAISLALIGLCVYLVHTWHGEIKAKGKNPSIGIKSIACILCCAPGGCLAICEPIDEA